ncbi:MAG: phosphoribosylaminoimidazolesuccinocarboxamide synthase [Candidatus Eisenbacteria bacterium]|nr:phosphoribosylaminoimidazolesuccinocarboxamide synthase [Candidatus Eisenbacteria bacterium]
MRKTKPLYEGKAKILWETDDPALMVQEFKNDATAFDGTKHEVIEGKGTLNNTISSHLFHTLDEKGVRTHFREKTSDTEMVVERLDMLRVEVVVRNIAAGSMVRRLGVEKGTTFDPAIVEFYLKDDDLHDPILSEEHVRALGLATPEQVSQMKERALRVNEILGDFLLERGIRLVDFKLEFGTMNGELVLGDEISPDTCRFHDAESGEIMDKDRFRQDLGGFLEAYNEVLSRVSSK